MRLARVLGAIGRALISAGVIVLLFVGYQLWGTGLQHAQAQGDLENELEQLLDSDAAAQAQQVQESIEALQVAAVEEAAAEAGVSVEELDEEVVEEIEQAAVIELDFSSIDSEFIAALNPAPGESLARLEIPDIGVDQITVEGVSVEDLRKGPGHYGSTPKPGQAGNSAIAGHRTTYGAPFHRVDELEPGASIFVTTVQGTFEYRVKENIAPDGSIKGHFIVSPSDVWVLGQDTGENLLTLTACHPKYSARQRIIVQAVLVGEPAPTIEGDADASAEISLSAGEEDEAGGDERAAEGSDEAGEETADDVAQVMSDEVAADDDPSVDADGNPIDDDADATTTADDTDEAADGEMADAADAGDGDADEAADGAAADEAADDAADGAPADNGAEADLNSDDIELTAAQSPFSDPEDFGEGLNGDRTKIQPAIMWGLAAGAIWLAAWFIGRRLDRKWTVYAMGLAPFALVLWSCFVNVDQALPSY